MTIVCDRALNAGEPTHAESGIRVIDVITRAYDQGLAAGEALGTPAIGRAGLEEAITYCADRACDRDGAYCTGCRLRTEADGIASLDEWIARRARVRVEATGLELVPGGPLAPTTVTSLDALARSWAGEEVYYLARRLHRRLHKERAPRPKRLAGAEGTEAPVVLLVAPQMAENIGMVARAMANFGLEELRLVAPRDPWPNEKARAAASGAHYITDAARAYPATEAAIGDLNWICATTARQRELAKSVLTPEQAAREMHVRIGEGQRVGMLFGAERQGLENDDIALADAIVMIPVNPRFASLNLAQAVLLLAYEWMRQGEGATLGRVTTCEAPLQPGLNRRGSPPATKEQLIGLFHHLEAELDRSGFLKPPEKRAHMVRNIRTMLERMEASEQEIRTLRGIVASLVRAHKRREEVP